MRAFLYLMAIFFVSVAPAEYRAFELVITDPTSGQERVVHTNLDPNQYRKYYPTKPDEKITYRQTWRCKGNTANYKAICPKPEKPAK